MARAEDPHPGGPGDGAACVHGVAQAAEEALGAGHCIWTFPHLLSYQHLQAGQYCISNVPLLCFHLLFIT